MKRQEPFLTNETIKMLVGLGVAIGASLIGGHSLGQKQIWTETGDHFQDLVVLEQAQAKEINALSNLVQQIKQPKGNKK